MCYVYQQVIYGIFLLGNSDITPEKVIFVLYNIKINGGYVK